MSWVRLDDQMAFHAKIVAAGNEAVGAWVRILALACAQLTDGHVTNAVALTIAKKKVLEDLVKVRLLDRTEDGYVVHDFLAWNPPASEVKAKREAERLRKETARKSQSRGSDGRMLSASRPAGQPKDVRAESERCPPLPSSSSPLPSSSSPKEKEIEEFTGQQSETRIRRLPAKDTRIEPDWQPREQEIAFGAERGVDAKAMRDDFVNHYVAAPKDKGLARDWNAKFRTWILNGIKFGNAPKLPTPRNLPPRTPEPPPLEHEDADASEDTSDLFAGIGNFGGVAR